MRTAVHSPPFQIPFTAIFSTLSMAESSHAGIHYVKYWQTIPDNLSKAGWSWGRVSAIDFDGRTIWIADWHRGDGKGFGVYADEESTSLFGLDCAETWLRHFEWTPIAQATSTNWAFGKSSDLLIKLPQKWARPSTRIGPVSVTAASQRICVGCYRRKLWF